MFKLFLAILFLALTSQLFNALTLLPPIHLIGTRLPPLSERLLAVFNNVVLGRVVV